MRFMHAPPLPLQSPQSRQSFCPGTGDERTPSAHLCRFLSHRRLLSPCLFPSAGTGVVPIQSWFPCPLSVLIHFAWKSEAALSLRTFQGPLGPSRGFSLFRCFRRRAMTAVSLPLSLNQLFQHDMRTLPAASCLIPICNWAPPARLRRPGHVNRTWPPASFSLGPSLRVPQCPLLAMPARIAAPLRLLVEASLGHQLPAPGRHALPCSPEHQVAPPRSPNSYPARRGQVPHHRPPTTPQRGWTAGPVGK